MTATLMAKEAGRAGGRAPRARPTTRVTRVPARLSPRPARPSSGAAPHLRHRGGAPRCSHRHA
eukprot:12767209-Alexandrium_andersonii.AAC.1